MQSRSKQRKGLPTMIKKMAVEQEEREKDI